jgi:hypothetical protein
MKTLITICTFFILSIFNIEAQNGVIGGLLKKVKEKKEVSASKNHFNDNGISEGLHKNHLKQIVFYKDQKMMDLSETDLRSSFVLGDSINACAYIEKSMANHLYDAFPNDEIYQTYSGYNLYLKWYVDGNLASVCEHLSNEVIIKKEWTRFPFKFYDATFRPWNLDKWQKFIKDADAQLTIGEHKIKLELIINEKNNANGKYQVGPIASGEFILKVNTKKLNINDPVYCLTKPMITNIKVEKAMMDAFVNIGLGEAKKAIITSERFVEQNSSTGAIISRSFKGLIVSNKNSTCAFILCGFKQYYNGSSYTECEITDKLEFTPFDCNCLK